MSRSRKNRHRPARSTTTSTSPALTPVGQTKIDFHRGEVLWTLANTYPSLMLTLVEGAQNGIDAEAKHVFIGIDLKQRRVTIADDGTGADETKFKDALQSVGKGVKSKDKLGRFGRGLIAPLNKCAHFTFTSKVSGRRPIRWTFRGRDIRQQHQEVHIPAETIREMPVITKMFRVYLTDEFEVQWKTIVHMEGVTRDKVISLVDLDELESQIRSKLGMAMRQHGVSIRVILIDENGVVNQRNIDPVMFGGERLGVLDYADTEGCAGMVQVDLYRAQKLGGKRSGEVLLMEYEGNYPIPMKEVARQFRGGREDLFDEVLDVLTSGYFEGIIRCENITLHPTRTKFEFDEALKDLFFLLYGSWYERVGKEQYENEQERSREQRYQRLGLESQERLKQYLPQSLYDRVRSVVKYGRLGDGHLDPAKGRLDGFDEDSSLRTGQGGVDVPRKPREPSEPRERQREPRDRPGDMPTGSFGPRGKERQLVRGDSEGIWFDYEPMFANSLLWEFDIPRGVITFNTKHPVWAKLDETNGRHTTKNEKQIMDLQEWLTLQILTLLINYPDVDEFELHRGLIDDQVKPYSELFILHKRR